MRTSVALSVLPSAATAVTVTAASSATPWVNGSYAEISASAPAGISLAGIQFQTSHATEAEIGIAVGAGGAEVEIASFRQGDPPSAMSRIQPLYLPIPITGISASRIAARHRNALNSAGPATATVKVLTAATTDTTYTTTAPLASVPAGTTGVTHNLHDSAWTNPAWSQLTSGLSDPISFVGLTFGSAGINFTEMEVGTGAGGAEVSLTVLRGYVTGAVRYLTLIGVHEIPANTRIAVRVRKSLATTSAGLTGVAALYYGNLVNTTALQRVTQLVMLYGYNRIAEEDPPPDVDACTGGGTVATGSNPTDGAGISTSTQMHAWIESTIGGTTRKWGKVGINIGTLKVEPRVLKFGTLTRALSDDKGGFESAAMTIALSDYDRTLRGLHATQTLINQTFSVYVQDEANIRAGGNPWRVFRGVARDLRPKSELTYELSLEDPLTLSMSAFAQETLVPKDLISISDGNADQGLRQTPVPVMYGSLSDEDEDEPVGTVEAPFIGTETVPGHEELGNLHKHLLCKSATGFIQSVFIGDPLSGDPPTRREKAGASEYGTRIYCPHQAGWFLSDDYSVEDSDRYTFVYIDQTHPGAQPARENKIPIAVNLCAREQTGNATGATIDSLPLQFLHFLNTEVAQDVGDANWPTIAARDGYSLFDTSTFTAAKTTSEARVSGGYKGAFVLGHSYKQITLRQAIAQFCRSGSFDIGINRHGQIIINMLDRSSTASSATTFTDQSDILKDSFTINACIDKVENSIRHAYARNYLRSLQQLNPDLGTRLPREPFDKNWLSGELTVSDSTEITNLGETRASELQEYEMVRNATTAADVAAQRLALRSPSNGRAEATFKSTLSKGYAVELGAVIKVTHFQGISSTGWSARRCQVRRIGDNLDAFTREFTVRDVDNLLS